MSDESNDGERSASTVDLASDDAAERALEQVVELGGEVDEAFDCAGGPRTRVDGSVVEQRGDDEAMDGRARGSVRGRHSSLRPLGRQPSWLQLGLEVIAATTNS